MARSSALVVGIGAGARSAMQVDMDRQRQHRSSQVAPMSTLIMELLAWVAARPRTYAEAMEAWRTSCPRNPVWEDATIDGLIEVLPGVGMERAAVRLTPSGRAVLAAATDGEHRSS